MHNAAFEQDIPEVMVHSCFFIVPSTAAALKEVIVWYISCMSFSSIPFDILHYRIAHRNITILIVLAECIEAVLGKPLIPAEAEALPEHKPVKYEFSSPPVMMVAEDPAPYGVKKEDK